LIKASLNFSKDNSSRVWSESDPTPIPGDKKDYPQQTTNSDMMNTQETVGKEEKINMKDSKENVIDDTKQDEKASIIENKQSSGSLTNDLENELVNSYYSFLNNTKNNLSSVFLSVNISLKNISLKKSNIWV
jgi:hypothetical protein